MLPPLKKVKIKKKTPTFHNGTHNAMYKNRYFLFTNNEKLSTRNFYRISRIFLAFSTDFDYIGSRFYINCINQITFIQILRSYW